MESCSFRTQMLSVMEVLAQAAVAEIQRRVADSCAVLRLEVNRSRGDIDALQRRCEAMEAELRRTRLRVRRKGFYPPAPPSIRLVLNRDRQMEAERQPLPSSNPEPVLVAEAVLVKEECAEDDDQEQTCGAEPPSSFGAAPPDPLDRYHSAENPAGPLVYLPDAYDAFPEQQLNPSQREVELLVKHEDEDAAPLPQSCTFVEEDAGAEPSFSYAGRQYEQLPPGLRSQRGPSLEDVEPLSRSVEKPHFAVVSAAREDDPSSQLSAADPSVVLPPTNPDEDLTAPDSAILVSSAHGRSGFVLARRMRTPWRPGVGGEKRFSCTYCDKSFMRFSQLKEHLRRHTGEKPFSCAQCGRSFTKQCNLIRHAVVHSGERPHRCSLCGKSFTQRSSLKSHEKTAH